MNCNICNKDHSKKNEGPLTTCELTEYLKGGANGTDIKGKRIKAFGIGTRFQFEGAK